jgi:murein DD-endopeptidase MepM/ murein hydrolase activator NlpD
MIPRMRKLVGILLVLATVAAAVWFGAGWLPGPAIAINMPGPLVGQSSPLDVTIGTPLGALTRLDVALEQGGQTLPVFTLGQSDPVKLVPAGDEQSRLTGSIGRRSLPKLKQGTARLVVRAAHPVAFGLRTAEQVATRDVQVRLIPPQMSVTSLHHFVNLGGSELVLYRVTPANAVSGVRVGDREYPAFPASGLGVANADPSLKAAFFALVYDQDVNTPIAVVARDEAGNEGRATFAYRVTPKHFRRSEILLDDRFLQRVVPAILQNTPDFEVPDPSNVFESFLAINRDLRRRNAEQIAALAKKTSPTRLWDGPFKQMVNTAVEAGFADYRTYRYQNKEVDRQVHLGFDLASLEHAPVRAANRGRVVYVGYLGIYGNTIVVDHGLGLQSLYAHLGQVDVKEGQEVIQDTQLGLSDTTGLAGGDHLHFTMLLNGHPVTPVDWWSKQWIEDRVMRKVREASRPGTL